MPKQWEEVEPVYLNHTENIHLIASISTSVTGWLTMQYFIIRWPKQPVHSLDRFLHSRFFLLNKFYFYRQLHTPFTFCTRILEKKKKNSKEQAREFEP